MAGVSELVQVALISATVPALVSVAIFSIGKFSEFQSKKEDNREWYKRTLFEKRLAVVQEAYGWLMRLNTGLNLANPTTPEAPENQELLRIAHEAREWYDNEAMLLYDDLPSASSFVGLMNKAGLLAVGKLDVSMRVWDDYEQVSQMVRERLRRLLELGSRAAGDHDR